MAKKFGISKTVTNALDEGRAALEEAVNDLREEWEERSERWQQSRAGQDVSDWLDTLEETVSELETVIRDIPADPG